MSREKTKLKINETHKSNMDSTESADQFIRQMANLYYPASKWTESKPKQQPISYSIKRTYLKESSR